MAVLAAYLMLTEAAIYEGKQVSRVDVDTLGNAHLVGISTGLFSKPEIIAVMERGRLSELDKSWLLENALPGQSFILDRVLSKL
jgi:hypothetical protein